MRLLLRGVIAAVALSLAPVAVVATSAAPARAAETVETTTSITATSTRGFAGGYLSASGAVATPDGSSPYAGTAYLQSLAPGATTWKNVGSDDSPGYAYFPDYDTFKTNTKLRIYYTGGTYAPGTSSERTYTPSTSRVLTIKVARNVDFDNVSGKRQPTADVKVSPKFGKKKIIVQKKQGKGYKTYRKFKTNKKGKVRISVPGSSKGIKYRLIAPGDTLFVATKLKFTASRY